MQDMTDLIGRARQFASDAHRNVGQLRKYSGQPYEEHLRSVAEMVSAVADDPEMIAAAWLHDVVEDTPTTIEDIERAFGPGLRELVDALTDVSRPHEGNRAARKALDRKHLAEPLPAFEAESPVALTLDLPDCPVFGVREQGRIGAYVPRAELGTGRFADVMRPVQASQVLDSSSGLANLVMTLTRHDYCFVSLQGEVAAYAGRDEMQSPVARMWLFGMVTTAELAITQQIRFAAAETQWVTLLTPARLEKARL